MVDLKKILKHPGQIILSLNHHGFFRFLSDKSHAKLMYRAYFGKSLNLEQPKSFNEKMQWLKLYDRNPIYTTLVDKFEVKRYVISLLGKEYVIPTYGVYDSFEEIDFNTLPSQFVLKTTHDGGGSGIVICKNKVSLDRVEARMILNKSLARDVYKDLREWPYKDVPHRILAEQYLENNGEPLEDFKIHCFNGEPKMILVCRDRYAGSGLTEDFYTADWTHIPVRRPKHPNSREALPKPPQLQEMLDLSVQLSKGIPFVRTDFYIVDGKVFFGEMTFYPTSGYTAFEPEKYDDIIGTWLNLKTK